MQEQLTQKRWRNAHAVVRTNVAGGRDVGGWRKIQEGRLSG